MADTAAAVVGGASRGTVVALPAAGRVVDADPEVGGSVAGAAVVDADPPGSAPVLVFVPVGLGAVVAGPPVRASYGDGPVPHETSKAPESTAPTTMMRKARTALLYEPGA
ncbi:MAG: hypothetical protein ACRD2W_11865 [Acidimicrobiales bacterium]